MVPIVLGGCCIRKSVRCAVRRQQSTTSQGNFRRHGFYSNQNGAVLLTTTLTFEILNMLYAKSTKLPSGIRVKLGAAR